ncbi:MAG: ABC transporter ATP-binding protein [Bacilli bacterium]|nr:ABC transporter ATP-binding protein [Bacilli bacterium]
MPRPGSMNGNSEKSKDFKGSMVKIFNSLNRWKYILIIALLLACLSSVFSIVAPNKLSDLTDVITKGIRPDTKKLGTIGKKISSNFKEDKLKSKIPTIMMDKSISYEDLNKFNEIMTKMSTIKDKKKASKLIVDIPDSILIKLMDDIYVDNIKISSKDQVKFLKLMSSIDKSKVNNKTLKKFDKLPKSIYNLVKPKIDMSKVKSISLLLAILYILSSVFAYVQAYLMATVSNNFAKRLRTDISNKINKLPLKYFDKHETGDILSRVTNDVDSIGMNMNQSLGTLISNVTLFLGAVIMMFVTDWHLALTAILSSIIGFMFMGLLLSKSQKYFNRRQKELGDLNGYIEEVYSGHNVVKAYNGDKLAKEEFRKINNELYRSSKTSQFLSGIMQPIMMFVGNFGYVAVCVVGALLTMNNIITFGVIVAFMIYIRLFTNPLSQIAQAMTGLQSTAAAAERVFEFLDEEEMTREKKSKLLDKSKVKGSIEFKNVKFGYNPDRVIIKDFNAKAKPGQKVAIVGPTGAGKTTMVNLLMKFYEINSGDIIIDGVNTKDLSREEIHDLFIMVLQDTWLFDGTVGENIRYNKKNASDEEVWKACKTVGIDHFIKTLPGGLNSKVTDNDTISQGQKQLLTIARGMIKDAPFLILDEATSNVDTRTEELVQKAMDKLTEGRTSFIIAHRLSTIKNADLILVMNEGNIIEQGTHDELIKQNGFYADLYNSQFEL